MKTVFEIKDIIIEETALTAWKRGVKEYALELIDYLIEGSKWNGLAENGFEFYGTQADYTSLLNGAWNWHQYSWGGCSLIYNKDIAERLCSHDEFILTEGGNLKPNPDEDWLDVQARALFQASQIILKNFL